MRRSDAKWVWLLNAPAYSLLTLFTLAPIAYSFYISLHNWILTVPPIQFVGANNYRELLLTELFWESLRNTLVFTSCSVAIIFFVSLSLACLLNESFKGVGLLRSLIIIPWTIPTIVNGIIWFWIFNARYGLFNYVLNSLGIITENISWLGTPSLAMLTVIIARSWHQVAFGCLILLAGLQMIPSDLYDSAKVDGATMLRRFKKITLPLLRNQILLLLVFETMWSFREFDTIYAMTYGGPGNATTVLGWMVYKLAFLFYDFGKAAGVGFILAVITSVAAYVYIKILYRRIEF